MQGLGAYKARKVLIGVAAKPGSWQCLGEGCERLRKHASLGPKAYEAHRRTSRPHEACIERVGDQKKDSQVALSKVLRPAFRTHSP